MKNSMFRVFGAAALAAGLMLAQNAGTGTGTPPPNHGEHGQWMLQRATAALNLTTDQQTQLQQLIANFRQSAKPLHQQLQADETALMNAAKANPAADFSAQANAVGKDLTQLSLLRAQSFGQFYALLNADQKQKVDSFGGHMPMFGGGFGHGRGR